MDRFLRLLRALLDTEVEIVDARIYAVLRGTASHRIEIRLARKEDVESVMNEARNVGLEPVELQPVEGAHFGITIAADTNYLA